MSFWNFWQAQQTTDRPKVSCRMEWDGTRKVNLLWLVIHYYRICVVSSSCLSRLDSGNEPPTTASTRQCHVHRDNENNKSMWAHVQSSPLPPALQNCSSIPTLSSLDFLRFRFAIHWQNRGAANQPASQRPTHERRHLVWELCRDNGNDTLKLDIKAKSEERGSRSWDWNCRCSSPWAAAVNTLKRTWHISYFCRVCVNYPAPFNIFRDSSLFSSCSLESF